MKDLPCSPDRALMRVAPEEGADAMVNKHVRTVGEDLIALGTMNMAELRKKYAQVFKQQTTSHNAGHLRKKLAWRIQEVAHGGVTERAQARIDELARDVPLRERPPAKAAVPANLAEVCVARDSRVPPPGTVLRKEHDGKVHEVTVAAGGFVHRGVTYGSLSAIAKAITGTTWNGLLFFGLSDRKRKGAA